MVLSCGQTDTQTDADERNTPATLVSMSNDDSVPVWHAARCWNCWRRHGAADWRSPSARQWQLASPTRSCGMRSTTRPTWPTSAVTATQTPTTSTMSLLSWLHRALRTTNQPVAAVGHVFPLRGITLNLYHHPYRQHHDCMAILLVLRFCSCANIKGGTVSNYGYWGTSYCLRRVTLNSPIQKTAWKRERPVIVVIFNFSTNTEVASTSYRALYTSFPSEAWLWIWIPSYRKRARVHHYCWNFFFSQRNYQLWDTGALVPSEKWNFNFVPLLKKTAWQHRRPIIGTIFIFSTNCKRPSHYLSPST